MSFMKSALTLAALALATPSFAADTYTIDPQHAWVNFSLNHAGWSTAQGTFHAVSGEIVFDKEDVTKSSVNVTIDATSLDTNDKTRDADMSSPDFLNSAEFPTITFVSTAVEKTGEKTGKVTGDMTMIGVSVPVTLDVTWNAEAPLPWDATVIKSGFTATGTVSPAAFGMGKVAEYGLGPDIAVVINVEATKN